MKIKNLTIILFVTAFLISCGPKDADLAKSITQQMSAMPGISVTVKDGIATITGECANESEKLRCESIAKGVKGVKSVVNNCTVTPPVVISPDQVLNATVTSALLSYPTVKATVLDGVITLNGEIERKNLMGVIQTLQALKPKKIENKLIIK